MPPWSATWYEDREIDDRAETDLDGVRAIRDDIDERVRALLAQLTQGLGHTGFANVDGRRAHEARRARWPAVLAL